MIARVMLAGSALLCCTGAAMWMVMLVKTAALMAALIVCLGCRGAPRVRQPTVAVAVSTEGSACSKDFTGDVTITVTYPAPPPPSQGEVRITLEVVEADNADVTLASMSLDTIRDNKTETVSLSGTLPNPCVAGQFRVRANVRQLPSSQLPSVTSEVTTVNARPFKVTMPAFARSTSNVDFETTTDDVPPRPTIELECCAAGAPWTIQTYMETNVQITAIAPAVLACPGAGIKVPFVIKGKVTNPTSPSPKAFGVRAVRGGVVCALGTIRVE